MIDSRYPILDHVFDKYQVLDKPEEKRLGQLLKNEDVNSDEHKRARDKLVLSNLRLVVRYANKVSRWSFIPVEDLIQEGMVGLLKAADKWDCDRGIYFCTYAMWWVKAKILSKAQQETSIIKVTTTNLIRSNPLFKAEVDRRLANQPDAELTEVLYEVAREKGIDTAQAEMIYNAYSIKDLSLDAPISYNGVPEDSLSLHDVIQDDRESIDELVASKSFIDLCESMLMDSAKLDSEKLVVKERILAADPVTFQHIATKANRSRERIRQLETRLYDKLNQKYHLMVSE